MVRRVPNYEQPADGLVEVFHALADATRLAVIERLSIGPLPTTTLARPFAMALPSFTQHLGVLERAGIVTSTKTGRVRVYQLRPESLALAIEWLVTHRSHWERRLDQLDAVLISASQTDSDRTSTKTSQEQS
jgi:DNA-binding transcriptional ArsR family regulator